MKTITRSLMVLGGIALLCAAAPAILDTNSTSFPTARLTYGPHPRDYVRIVEGTPLVVPPGRYFVPTALGSNTSPLSSTYELFADGNRIVHVTIPASPLPFDDTSVRPLPDAVALPAGSVVTVAGGSGTLNDARAWGYLAAPSLVKDASITYRLDYQPAPEDMLSIASGPPWTVPPGRILVVTAIGSVEPSPGTGLATLSANGVIELASTGPRIASMVRVPRGCAFGAGTAIQVSSSTGSGRLWGYLVQP
jgi:hypothetical protein